VWGWVDPLGLTCKQSGYSPPYTYRGDTRGPEVIFEQGFQPKGESTDLLQHAIDNNNPPSNYISTSKTYDVAAGFGTMGRTTDGYVYVIRPKNGIDVNKKLGSSSPWPDEHEIAIPGGVHTKDIRGVTPVDSNGVHKGYSLLNPNFEH
jgi:hypothetical protein